MRADAPAVSSVPEDTIGSPSLGIAIATLISVPIWTGIVLAVKAIAS